MLFDEILQTTSIEEGFPLSFGVLEHTLRFKESLCLASTHNYLLTKILLESYLGAKAFFIGDPTGESKCFNAREVKAGDEVLNQSSNLVTSSDLPKGFQELMRRNFKEVQQVAEITLQKCQKFETLTAALVEEERRE